MIAVGLIVVALALISTSRRARLTVQEL
jgi:hypothetical protein